MHLSVRLSGVAALAVLLAPPSSAQHPAVPPTTWAITGARIEPASGPVIEKGTIVIRDGLITAVGADVRAPADARIVDGDGLTVYPGLIDASTSLGMPSRGGGGGRGQAATPQPSGAPNSNYGLGMQAEIRAATELEPAADGFKAAHGAGFTAALTAQGSGIFRGTSAVITLRDAPVPALVVRDGIAQHIGFSRGGGGGFPGSLMGVFAQLRQELLDAQHYRDLKAAYARNPRGMNRPDHDPTLEALQPVLAGTMPVVMAANSEREIIRALDLAKEFGLKPIIAGGREAYKVTDRLRAENVVVLLDIDFPRRTAPTGGRAAANEDPVPERMDVLRDRVELPKSPGRLAGAGVRFAIASGNDYTNFLGNARHAVEAGLDPVRALKAMTIDPATLFGVSDRLGSIEVGKIANLTLVKGGLFDESAKITQLFVDGNRIEIAAAAAPSAGTGETPRRGAPGDDTRTEQANASHDH
ncbi:MAG TPA: amidohydrolase family protein [Gemmatimonadales bacterium]|nr:amidohydrolase family protein [Gemmatimonadales bacterium]